MYYTLIGRATPTEPFQIVWGDYDRLNVEEELAYHDDNANPFWEYTDESVILHGAFEWFDLTIIESSDQQDDINLAVAQLNGGI